MKLHVHRFQAELCRHGLLVRDVGANTGWCDTSGIGIADSRQRGVIGHRHGLHLYLLPIDGDQGDWVGLDGLIPAARVPRTDQRKTSSPATTTQIVLRSGGTFASGRRVSIWISCTCANWLRVSASICLGTVVLMGSFLECGGNALKGGCLLCAVPCAEPLGLSGTAAIPLPSSLPGRNKLADVRTEGYQQTTA